MSRLITFGILGVLWIVVKTIYRLYFHPLSKFPGPKLLAATSLYESYFNIIKGGMFIWEMERLHNVYGTSYPTYKNFQQSAQDVEGS